MSLKKGIAWGLVVVGGGVALWSVGVNALASRREKAADESWAESLGPIDDLARKFPRRVTNSSAFKVEAATVPLGIELTPKDARGARATTEAAKTFDAARDQIGEYLTSQIEKADAVIDPLPEKVRTFVADHSREIDAMAVMLNQNQAPAWEIDIDALSEAPIPNLLGHMKLQRTLLVAALGRAQAGPSEQAVPMLNASFRLNEGLRDRPDLISQLIAVAIARMELGVLRKVPVEAAAWTKVLREHDYRASVLASLQMESWQTRESIRRRRLEGYNGNAVADFFRWPVFRLQVGPLQDGWRSMIVAARSSEVTDGDGTALGAKFNEGVARSGSRLAAVLGAISMPNITNAWKRVDRLVIETEMTEKILQATALRVRGAKSEAWPKEVPGIEASRFSGGKWSYAVTPEGKMTLSFNRELHWPGQLGPILPLKYVSAS